MTQQEALSNTKKILLVMPWILFFQFMQNFNENVFGLITPDIKTDLALTTASVSWVVSISGIIFGICCGVYAALSDIISMRKIFIFGVLAFSAGSIIGFMSLNFEMVIFARAIQSIGAGVIPGCLVVFISKYVPKEHKVKYIGYTTAIFQLSAATGHYVGGIVATNFNWHINFLLPVLTILCLPAFIKYLPTEEVTNTKFKLSKQKIINSLFLYIGALLLSLSILLIIMSITYMNLSIFLAAILVVTIFITYSIYTEKNNFPVFLSLSIFNNKVYSFSILLTFMIFGIQAGIFFIFPFIMKDIHSVTSAVVGYLYLPTNILAFIVGVSMSRIATKVGKEKLVFIGGITVLSSLLIFLIFLTFNGIFFMATALLLFCCGFPFIFVGMYNYIDKVLPESQKGAGFGIFNMGIYFAFAVMPSIAGAFMTYHSNMYNKFGSLVSQNISLILILFITIIVISLLVLTLNFRKIKFEA